MISVGISSKLRDTRYDLARDRARSLLVLMRQRPPVDIEAIIERAGVPVVQRALGERVRATVGDVAGRRAIILNRNYQIRIRRTQWILAEELGHVLLDHHLVDSTAPGRAVIGLLEARRVVYEREARAFAAELLMPFAEVSRRWFGLLREHPVTAELSTEDRVRRLAVAFEVTPSAMRVRLEQMRLITQ
jgi:Zn-dependent peptidase ImmA (M78 family)